MAYEIKGGEKGRRTFEQLNFREKCGYTMIQVEFVPTFDFSAAAMGPLTENSRSAIKCICYYADETNHYYSASGDQEAMARQIATSAGPSGTNREYLFNFCQALRNLLKDTQLEDGDATLEHDGHIFELERRVRELDAS